MQDLRIPITPTYAFGLSFMKYTGKKGLRRISKRNFTIEEKVSIIQDYQKTGLSLMDTPT